MPSAREHPGSEPAPPTAALRAPAEVMRLGRMGAFFPTRLSFMRRLLRRLRSAHAGITRPLWEIDAQGYGRAVYRVSAGGRVYSLCCFSRELDARLRTDRVIAEAWDAAFVLYDGEPDAAALERLAASAPLQEGGRFEARDLVLSRANKSVRAFDHVVERLASGEQPDPQVLRSVGYLMRTTAVYGNGKFGIADRERLVGDPLMRAPFQAELLSVYLIRAFTHDLVEHVAAHRGGARSVRLAPALARHIGVGNSTGLGMAPFLVAHPVLLNNWMLARETALARVRGVERAGEQATARFLALLTRARAHVGEWRVDDDRQRARIEVLAAELGAIQELATAGWLGGAYPWERLIEASLEYSLETQECLVALVLEPYPELVDGLTECMDASVSPRLEPGMTLARLAALTEEVFGWVRGVDFDDRRAVQRFWYVSEEKLEPRLGERLEEPGADRELPLGLARDARALLIVLDDAAHDDCVASLVMTHPELRHIVRRVQTAARAPYSEIRDNLLDGAVMPIDMLRCKLSFFGASKFDPRSDRWTRITLFQGAPTREEFADAGTDVDNWCFPTLAGSA